MPHPPRVSVPDALGAQILRFETQVVTMRERIGEINYVGQTFTFVVFPRRGGRLDIPAADVTLLDRGGDPSGSAKGEAQHIEVDVPAGLDASGPVLAARGLTLEQTWTPSPTPVQVHLGAAFERTIRRQAAGVPALGMADFVFTAPLGVRIYVDPPQVDDRVNRGDVEGSRTDKVTYVFQQPGSYDLPALTQPWWDMDSKQAGSQTLEGLHVVVAPASVLQRSKAVEGKAFTWLQLLLAAACALVSLAVFLSAAAMGRRRWLVWKQQYAASEASSRHALCKIAETGDAAATYRALQTWLNRRSPESTTAIGNDPRLRSSISDLDSALFGTAAPWSIRQGMDLAQKIRTRSPAPLKREKSDMTLPPLNPSRASL